MASISKFPGMKILSWNTRLPRAVVRSTAAALVSFGLLALTAHQGALAEPGKRAIVVELYTSQGCNSCPPADKLLGVLAERDDVVALTFNVDYWDYLGWKDTLAQAAYTERQRHYAASLRNRTVYTPQMVIGGRQHAVGSDRAAVEAAIEAERRRDAEKQDAPALRIEHRDGRILVTLSAAKDNHADATVWLVRYDQRRDVPIERGENAGHNLSYFNVARDMRALGQWHGQAMQLDLSRDQLAEGGRDGCAIIVQKGPVGPVLAAARIIF